MKGVKFFKAEVDVLLLGKKSGKTNGLKIQVSVVVFKVKLREKNTGKRKRSQTSRKKYGKTKEESNIDWLRFPGFFHVFDVVIKSCNYL